MKTALLLVGLAVLSISSSALPAPTKVRVGYCTVLKNLEAAKAAGFEYVELSATEIASLSDADFAAAAARIKELGIATPAANLFLPSTMKVTGPGPNPDAQIAHLPQPFTRLPNLGPDLALLAT